MFRIPGVALLLSVLLVQQPHPPSATLSRYDRSAALLMLHQVKADLKENYYDRTFRGMHVEQAFNAGEERLKGAQSVSEAIGIIADLLIMLNDSHTVFLPPGRKARVTYGWQASMIGDEPYVTAVFEGSDAQKKGLAPGDRIVAWNRFEVTRQNLWQIYYLYNFIQPQSLQHVTVRKPDGAERGVDVASKVEQGDRMEASGLPDTVVQALSVPGDRYVSLGETFVWRYSAFLDPRDVDAVMKKAKKSKSVVLDLRGNAGGNIEALRTLVSHLFDRDVMIATERTRNGDKPINTRGRRDAFAGSLTVLVDSASGSASEVLARLVQIEKRGRVIGDRTAGAVMTARVFPHVFGIHALAFYGTTITIADVQMPDGGSLEHLGVSPDELALPTGADLAARRDPVLARAIARHGGEITAEAAGRLYR